MSAVHIEELDTPALTVDLDRFEENVHRALERLAGVRVRPHLKTAKSAVVARLLLEAGAAGVCVAKLGEAEVMLAGGIEDVLITTELVGPTKARRLAELLDRFPAAHMTVVVDSWEGARDLHVALPRPLDTLIDVNVGQNRCGVAPVEAAELAERLRALPRLRIVGLQGYEGNLQHVRDRDERRRLCLEAMDRLAGAADGLRAGGHAVEVVTTGGTGTAEFCAEHPAVTEVQPGSFMFMDSDYLDTPGVTYQPALAALSTVISRPTADRAVLDAGLKTLSDDSGPARAIDAPGWSYRAAGDEHGTLSPAPGPRRDLQVGDRVTLLPSHIDTTINLHDELHVHRSGAIVATWAVAARGRVR